MSDKKTLMLSKRSVIGFAISFILGFLVILGLNHTGKFTYNYDTSNVPHRSPDGKILMTIEVPNSNHILSVTYTSYFGSEIQIPYPGYTIEDMKFETDNSFNVYQNKVQYYINGTLKDYKYVLLIGAGLFLIYLFFSRFKFQIT